MEGSGSLRRSRPPAQFQTGILFNFICAAPASSSTAPAPCASATAQFTRASSPMTCEPSVCPLSFCHIRLPVCLFARCHFVTFVQLQRPRQILLWVRRQIVKVPMPIFRFFAINARTRHTSHVTRHTSHVTRRHHQPRAIHRTSHVTILCRSDFTWSAGDVYDGQFRDHMRHGPAE